MIRSMTGYGRYEAENEESRLVVEIKSVNHRYCDIYIRLPKILNPYENLIRKQLKEKISRGKVDVFITYENIAHGEDSIAYHPDMARAYVNLIRQLSDDFSLKPGLDAAMLSRYPDVYTMEEIHIDEDKQEVSAGVEIVALWNWGRMTYEVKE